MSNFKMNINLFNNDVQCETKGSLVNLNDLERAGNAWRLNNNMKAYQLHAFLNSSTLNNYVEAASKIWGLPKEAFLVSTGRGRTSRTMGHVSLAILLAEQISPMFHAMVHKEFIEGKILEYRDIGASEFQTLNKAIDSFLPGREDKTSNKGIYISVAKAIRSKVLGPDAESEDWNRANASQTHVRYEYEKKLCGFLEMGLVKDYDHLKELIDKLK